MRKATHRWISNRHLSFFLALLLSFVGGTGNAGIAVIDIIPKSLSDEEAQDSEANLAVNPSNPRQMAASAFTVDPLGAANLAPIFVSTDGGNTWSLNSIVPSARQTADITLRFGKRSSTLYVGF